MPWTNHSLNVVTVVVSLTYTVQFTQHKYRNIKNRVSEDAIDQKLQILYEFR
jgi:hypothetical protein